MLPPSNRAVDYITWVNAPSLPLLINAVIYFIETICDEIKAVPNPLNKIIAIQPFVK